MKLIFFLHFILLFIYRLGNDKIVDGILKSTQASNGLYITNRHIKIPQSDIHPETNINCILSIPKTNYTKKRETVYFGK